MQLPKKCKKIIEKEIKGFDLLMYNKSFNLNQ